MWDLNGSPDQRRDDESEGCSSQKTSVDGEDDKGKRVGSVSNSSSSALVIEDGSDDEEDGGGGGGGGDRGGRIIRRRSSKIFGFSVPHHHFHEEEEEDAMESEDPPVTRQFFPVEDLEMGATSMGGGGVGVRGDAGVGGVGPGGFPRAHWVGVKFCQSESVASQKSSIEVSQPLKKSRRGPRSRSSQYRGVTYYRRTGRWESHIWSVVVV